MSPAAEFHQPQAEQTVNRQQAVLYLPVLVYLSPSDIPVVLRQNSEHFIYLFI